MFNQKIAIVLGLLLLAATVCLAQTGSLQTVHITQGNSVKLQASSDNAVTYQWHKDGTAISGAKSAFYMAQNAGAYHVISYNLEGCASPPSPPVTIIVDPPVSNVIADMSIVKSSESRAIALNEPFDYTLKVKNNGPNAATSIKVLDPLPEDLVLVELMTPTIGIATYNESVRTITWLIPKMEMGELGDLKIRTKTLKYGMIKNTATVSAVEQDPNLSNNISTDEKALIGISIPNVFTPNNDGKNDNFEITGLKLYENNILTIINRWGSPVYEKTGYLNDWKADGLSEGTYFYVLKVKASNTTWQEFKGYVTVMR